MMRATSFSCGIATTAARRTGTRPLNEGVAPCRARKKRRVRMLGPRIVGFPPPDARAGSIIHAPRQTVLTTGIASRATIPPDE